MKKLTSSLLAATAMMMAATNANATFLDGICLLVGLDYQEVWMKEKSRRFGQTFPKAYPGATLYLGARLCPRLGLELGYDWTPRRSTGFIPGLGNLSLQRKGGHLDVSGYLPIVDCLELMGVIGVGDIRPTVQSTLGGVTTTLSAKNSLVLRLRGGLNYLLTECAGIRGLLGWESTNNRFRIPNKAFDNSYTAAAGVYFKF